MKKLSLLLIIPFLSFGQTPCLNGIYDYSNMGWCDNFILECEEDGSYATIQCCDNSCWCVTEMGVEIPGTSNTLFEGVPDCDEPYLTYVPDDAFELLIETTIPSASNGNNNDNFVFSYALQLNTVFTINNNYGPIFDLTGLEDFTFTFLEIDDTYITSLDLINVNFNNTSGQTQWNSVGLKITENEFLEQIILPEDTLISIRIYDNDLLNNIVFNPDFGFSSFLIGSTVSGSQLCQPNLCEARFEGSIIAAGTNTGSITIYSPDIYQLDFSNILSAPYQTEIFIGTYGALYESSINQINLNNNISIYNWLFSPYLAGLFSEPEICVQLNNVASVEFAQATDDWPNNTFFSTVFTYATNCYTDNFNCSSVSGFSS